MILKFLASATRGFGDGVSMEKGMDRRTKPYHRVGVGDRISFVNVTLEAPFKSLKR